MKDLTFNLVELVASNAGRKKNNLLNVVLFLLYIGLAALFIFVFQSKLIPILLMIPFGIASYFVSKKTKELVPIGTLSFSENSIELVNERKKAERTIETREISNILIRGGIEINTDILNKKSLFIDLVLSNQETVTAHIGIIELDEFTADLITDFCKEKEIPCQRKL
jgi:hypothetical protein